MINRILMELYDDYNDNNNIESLLEFARKTFPNDGSDSLFIGCVLILFSIAWGSKPRYFCTRENLLSIVLLSKERIDDSNLLFFYTDRVNTEKHVTKYINKLKDDANFEQHVDLVIDYLEQFKLDFASQIRKHHSLEKYLKSIEDKTHIS